MTTLKGEIREGVGIASSVNPGAFRENRDGAWSLDPDFYPLEDTRVSTVVFADVSLFLARLKDFEDALFGGLNIGSILSLTVRGQTHGKQDRCNCDTYDKFD